MIFGKHKNGYSGTCNASSILINDFHFTTKMKISKNMEKTIQDKLYTFHNKTNKNKSKKKRKTRK